MQIPLTGTIIMLLQEFKLTGWNSWVYTCKHSIEDNYISRMETDFISQIRELSLCLNKKRVEMRCSPAPQKRLVRMRRMARDFLFLFFDCKVNNTAG